MAEQQFYTLITNVGQAKLANATALGTKVNFAKLQVGDGKDYNPNEAQENLKHKVWEGSINSITTDPKNPNWIVIQTLIPASVGGFNINEVGVFDDEGNMLIISKYPETYKPKLENGSGKDLIIKLVIQVSNTESVTLKIDPSITIATKEDIKKVEKQIGNIKVPVQSVNGKTGKVTLKAEDITAKDGTNLEKFKENLTTQYEDYVKKTDKKVQDFIDTKNSKNGIAGLDENGKVKKEQLPKIDSNILSIDSNKFKPILSFKPEKQFILMNSSKITSKGRTFEIDEKYLYMFDGQICKYDKNTFELVAQTYNSRNNYADTSCIDDSFLYSSELNTSVSCIYKFDKNTLQTVATSPTSNDYTLRGDLVTDKEFLYAVNTNGELCKFKKSDFSIVAKLGGCYQSCGKNLIDIDKNYVYCRKDQSEVIKVDKKTFTIVDNFRVTGLGRIHSFCYKNGKLYLLQDIISIYDTNTHNIIEKLSNCNVDLCNSKYIKIDDEYIYLIYSNSTKNGGDDGYTCKKYDNEHGFSEISKTYSDDYNIYVKSYKNFSYLYDRGGLIKRIYKNKLYKILGYEKIEEE